MELQFIRESEMEGSSIRRSDAIFANPLLLFLQLPLCQGGEIAYLHFTTEHNTSRGFTNYLIEQTLGYSLIKNYCCHLSINEGSIVDVYNRNLVNTRPDVKRKRRYGNRCPIHISMNAIKHIRFTGIMVKNVRCLFFTNS